MKVEGGSGFVFARRGGLEAEFVFSGRVKVRAYVNGRLVADHFYNGWVWEIGLRRFAPEVLKHRLRLVFLPLRADAPIYLAPEHRPGFEVRSEVLEVRRVMAQGEVERVFQVRGGSELWLDCTLRRDTIPSDDATF